MLTSTGFIRKMDELGRVTLPSECLHTLHMEGRIPLAIYVDGDKVALKKYRPCCIFCGHEDHTETFRGQTVCHHCLQSLSIKAIWPGAGHSVHVRGIDIRGLRSGDTADGEFPGRG